MLRVPHDPGPPLVVKDYQACSAPVRWILAPLLVGHELAMLERARGLPGLPRPYGRVDRLALAMEHVDGIPLRRRSHGSLLPRAFFDALEGILDGLALRGIVYLDLRSPTNILSTHGAPALVDLASAFWLPLPALLTRRLERSALAKLRGRFQCPEGGGKQPPVPLEYQELTLGRRGVSFLDRGWLQDPVPALFLHDVGHSAEVFCSILEQAQAHRRRGIGLDLPGFGGSPLRGAGLRLAAVARHVGRLVDALRLPQVDLVGHGWGGLVARVLAVQRPDRVRALLTLDTPLDHLSGSFAKRRIEALRDPEVLRRRLLRELPAGLSEPQRTKLAGAIASASARALRLAYAGIRVRKVPRSDAGSGTLRVDLATPQQPWLVVRSETVDASSLERETGGVRVDTEWWSQPFADPPRFWNALERLRRGGRSVDGG